MEEVAPVSASDGTLLAPEEIKVGSHIFWALYTVNTTSNNLLLLKEKNKAGDILGDAEKTSTDKQRERRRKKKVKRLKIKEREKRQKLKESSQAGQNKKPSKSEVAENLKKLTKGGKATILKVSVCPLCYTTWTQGFCLKTFLSQAWQDKSGGGKCLSVSEYTYDYTFLCQNVTSLRGS